MSSAPSSLHRPFDEAPARASLRGRGPGPRAFDFVSRGDFVSGRLESPEASGDSEPPLVLVLHDTASGADAPGLDFTSDWTTEGLAVARIDLPLHGRRQSPKLSERLVTGYRGLARGEPLDADTRALVEEFARQSVSDIVRACQALGATDGIDATRIALVGLGIGACACAWAAPHVPSLLACVLAGGVGEFKDAVLDPARRIGTGDRGAPAYRLHARGDDVPPTAIAALAKALPEGAEAARLKASDVEGGLAASDAEDLRTFLASALSR